MTYELWPGATERSLPTRGAWIEISELASIEAEFVDVAPHTGSVD